MSYKKINISILLIFCFVHLYAANNDYRIIDSLNREVRSSNLTLKKKAVLLTELAKEYSRKENYFEANNANLEALEIYKELGDNKATCKMLVEIGMAYDKQNQYDQAFKYFFESLDLLESIKNEFEIKDYQLRRGLILMNIGIIYGQVENTQQSLDVLKEANILFSNSNKFYQAICNENLGNAYSDLNLNKEALICFKNALDYYQNNDVESILIANTYSNIGNIYKKLNLLNEALIQFNKALTTIENEEMYLSEKIGFLNNIGDLYIDLNELTKAEKYLDSSLLLSNANGGNRYIRNNYSSLVKLYTKQKMYEKAFLNLNKLKSIEDSFYQPEVLERIAKIQKEYDLKASERENILKIQLLENEKALYWYKMYIIIAIVFVLTLTIFFLYLRQKQKAILNKIKLKNITLEKHQLSENLEFKNQQLTNFAMYIVRKNEFLEKIKEELAKILKLSTEKSTIKPLATLINQHLLSERDQKDFEILIENENKDFYFKLDKNFPDLSENNKKLCTLLLLNLSSKEIASLQNISVGSVEKSRHRLRKKLNLDTETNLSEFLNNL